MNQMTTPPKPPNPGSPEAQSLGCICPVLDNGHGRTGWLGSGQWVIRDGCPVHDGNFKQLNKNKNEN